MRPPRSLRQEQAALLLRKAAQDEVLLDAVLEMLQVYNATISSKLPRSCSRPYLPRMAWYTGERTILTS